MFRLSRWRPRELLLAWTAWWVAVPLIALSRAILVIQRVTRDHGAKSSVSLGVGDGGLSLTVTDAGRTIWANSVGILPAVLILAVPPLLLWMAWLRSRPRGARLSAHEQQLLNEPVDAHNAASRQLTNERKSSSE